MPKETKYMTGPEIWKAQQILDKHEGISSVEERPSGLKQSGSLGFDSQIPS